MGYGVPLLLLCGGLVCIADSVKSATRWVLPFLGLPPQEVDLSLFEFGMANILVSGLAAAVAAILSCFFFAKVHRGKLIRASRAAVRYVFFISSAAVVTVGLGLAEYASQLLDNYRNPGRIDFFSFFSRVPILLCIVLYYAAWQQFRRSSRSEPVRNTCCTDEGRSVGSV